MNNNSIEEQQINSQDNKTPTVEKNQPKASEPLKKKSKWWLWVLISCTSLIIIAIVIIIVGAIWIYNKSADHQDDINITPQEYSDEFVTYLQDYQEAIILFTAINHVSTEEVSHDTWQGWITENELQWEALQEQNIFLSENLDALDDQDKETLGNLTLPFVSQANAYSLSAGDLTGEAIRVRPPGENRAEVFTTDQQTQFIIETYPPQDVAKKLMTETGMTAEQTQVYLQEYKAYSAKSYKESAGVRKATEIGAFLVVDVGGLIATGPTLKLTQLGVVGTIKLTAFLLQSTQVALKVADEGGKLYANISGEQSPFDEKSPVVVTEKDLSKVNLLYTAGETLVEAKSGKFNWRNYVNLYQGVKGYYDESLKNTKNKDKVIQLKPKLQGIKPEVSESGEEILIEMSDETYESLAKKYQSDKLLQAGFPAGVFIVDGDKISTDPDIEIRKPVDLSKVDPKKFSQGLQNCLCQLGCTKEKWNCAVVSCYYDTSNECSENTQGECYCGSFGCGRASMVTTGDEAQSCYEKYGLKE